MFQRKQSTIVVSTFDADLEFSVKGNIKGKDLFDLVARAIGLRESWFFGLFFKDQGEEAVWIRRDKKVRKQLTTKQEPVHVYLHVQFYPEDVGVELTQEITQHLFFLQIQNAVLDMDIYCPAEASVLLASYALQAKYGDYDPDVHKPGSLSNEILLPKRVSEQYQLTREMWEEKIIDWYAGHRGLHRCDAKLEYLKIVQDLDMYGVIYFRIKNRKHTELWLGIHATGINIYEYNNKLNAKVSFSWSETRHISFRNTKFYIQSMDKESVEFVFLSPSAKLNRQILDLCIGNHDLYMKRRRPDTIEVQQMKIHAREGRRRREEERNRALKDRQEREQLALEREELRLRIRGYEEELGKARQLLVKSEQTTELLAEKSKIVEEESHLLFRKARDLENEIEVLQSSIIKSNEEKLTLETKVQNAQFTIHKILQESDMRSMEAGLLREALQNARLQETDAIKNITEFTYSQNRTPTFSTRLKNDVIHGSSELLNEDRVAFLSQTIQKERVEYLQKSQSLQEQLTNLRSEIEGLKYEARMDPLDQIHLENEGRGDNKYSTLMRVLSGTMDTRVEFYEQL